MATGWPGWLDMIECQNLNKSFAGRQVIDDVSFQVAQGSVTALLGPNGAGKTTTMRMLSGFLTPDSGKAMLGGQCVQHHPHACQKTLGYLPEGAPAWAEMTPTSLFRFAGNVHRLSDEVMGTRLSWLKDALSLHDVMQQRFETLSKGFKRRVGFALALLHDPDVLILDEPTDGLDPNQKAEVRRLIQELAADKAVLVSTHLLEEVDAMCDRVIVLANGRVVANETPAALRQRAPDCGVFALSVPAAEQHQAETLLSSLGRVGEVNADSNEAHVELKLHAHEASLSVHDVWRALADEGVPVLALNKQAGSLDQVFHDLTQAKTTTSEAAS